MTTLNNQPLVGVVMGSHSDWAIMSHTVATLEKLGVAVDARVISAHRTPDLLDEWVGGARERGMQLIIAGAGLAAHLAGVAAAKTTLPVLGVPLAGGSLGGADALHAMVQMPKGIPVGTLAIGKHGAINAALLAAAIIGLSNETVRANYEAFREDQTRAGELDSAPHDEAPANL
jgi:5-(carboxyamino)imidazole ribonucleotide mutase